MALSTVAVLAGAASFTAVASAQGARVKPTKVVKEADRGSFGEILTTEKGLSLYVNDGSTPCTGGCLDIWPPLLLPKGKTKAGGPAGLTGLGTVKFGSNRRQVTYNSQPLYTFDEDSGTSVRGNDDNGFFVAKVS